MQDPAVWGKVDLDMRRLHDSLGLSAFGPPNASHVRVCFMEADGVLERMMYHHAQCIVYASELQPSSRAAAAES